MPSSSHSEAPTSCPCAAKNGKHIAPPISTRSAISRKRSSTPILSVTFAPPTIATSGRPGRPGCRVSVSTSRCSSRPAALGSSSAIAVGRGVRAVRGAERVVDVDVAERRERLRQLGVVLVSPGKKRTFSSMQQPSPSPTAPRASRPGGRRPPAARRGGARPARARTRVRRALGPAEVREQDELRGALLAQLVERRQRGADPRVVGDAPSSSSGTLKSTRTTTRLPATLEVVEGPHARGPSAPGPRRGWSSPTRCRTRRRPSRACRR